MNSSVYAAFTEWLAEELERRNWNPAELARRGGFARSSASRALNPDTPKQIGLDVAKKIARALQVPQDEVLRRAGLLDRKPQATHDHRYLEDAYNILSTVGREQELVAYARFLLSQARLSDSASPTPSS